MAVGSLSSCPRTCPSMNNKQAISNQQARHNCVLALAPTLTPISGVGRGWGFPSGGLLKWQFLPLDTCMPH